LIPAIWPAYAILIGEFDSWIDGVAWQTHRQGIRSLFDDLIGAIFKIDPVLLVLAAVGSFYAAAIRRDFLFLLWIVPFLIFLYFIGFVSTFYFIPFLPALCISTAALITDISYRISNKNKKTAQRKILLPAGIIVSAIGIFGLLNTTLLITTNLHDMKVNSVHFKIVSFVTQKLLTNNYKDNSATYDDINEDNKENKVTVIGSPSYFWIPRDVFDKEVQNDYKGQSGIIRLKTEKVILIVDSSFLNIMSEKDEKAKQLMTLYNNSRTLIKFNVNKRTNFEIKANY
jgi:hypothetical protein